MGMMEGEKMGSHRKGFLKLKRLSPLKMLTSSLFEETFRDFLFLFVFVFVFLVLSLSFSALSPEDLGVSMIFEEKITTSKTSFQMASIYRGGRIFRSGVMHDNMAQP
jgi:hypothetical protein